MCIRDSSIELCVWLSRESVKCPRDLYVFHFHSLRRQWLSKHDDVWQRIQTSSQLTSFPSSYLFLERTLGSRLEANGHRCYRCWCNKRKRRQEEKVVVKCARRPHNGKTCNFMSWKKLKRLWNVQKLKMHVESVQKYCFSSFNTLWFVTLLSPSSSWLLKLTNNRKWPNSRFCRNLGAHISNFFFFFRSMPPTVI